MSEKVIAFERVSWKSAIWFVSLMLIAIILPRFIHNQFITGPIVNATLFIGVATLGVGPTMLIGLVPSVTALASGFLPIAFAPIVPFIMIANTILVVSFSYLKQANYWLAVIFSSLVKYIFLYATSLIVTQLIVQKTIALKAAATMMAWPQLVTALAGGVIAYGVIKFLKINNK
ncbi:MAG: iron hydrogenase [Patescibacteria group bacterium]|nr:iron hydrogenase [Patescibacteria group bacterium]